MRAEQSKSATQQLAGGDARACQVAEAIHSCEMEGLSVSEATRRDGQDYVAGLIDADELVGRTRARYGLH